MKFYKIILLLFLVFIVSANAQSGMKLSELEKKLDTFFPSEMLEDLEKSLPQEKNFSIWGWDVGDFSGDGVNDLALSIRVSGEKKKINQVYLFVDNEGFLMQVTQFPVEYVEMPLEIGVVIRHNTCYVTKKRQQFDWVIKGFRFESGALVYYDEYMTHKVDKFTNESYCNYLSLRNTERYIYTNNGKERFKSDFMKIPSYSRGRLVYKGYPSDIYCANYEYVPKGAFYWKGEDDCSFYVKSAYDEENLYMTVTIKDDIVVSQYCDSCPGDYVELWFNTTPIPPSGNRFIKKSGDKITFIEDADGGIYSFRFYPGDFLEKRANLKDVSCTDKLESYQKEAIKKIRVASSLVPGGYRLKFKIPFTVFGFESSPIDSNKITEFGCSIAVHDIDNEFRPEEETVVASSSFDSRNPSSYGTIMLIPKDTWYGEAKNIFKEDIIKDLQTGGF